jgi:hypothetical protein
MSKIINLFAGPGTGKTAIAAGVLYELKKRHISCDAPYEFPKVLAWDDNQSAIKDQLYVLANQHRGIVQSFGKVEYIVMDSPIILSLIYKNYYNGTEYPSSLYTELFDKMVLDIHSQYENLNIVLKRGMGVFNKTERYQDLGQSIELDYMIMDTLDLNEIPYMELEVDENTVNRILIMLGEI